jgi:hypothetical protein
VDDEHVEAEIGDGQTDCAYVEGACGQVSQSRCGVVQINRSVGQTVGAGEFFQCSINLGLTFAVFELGGRPVQETN